MSAMKHIKAFDPIETAAYQHHQKANSTELSPFEQSFSDEGGETWEINWVNKYTRIKSAHQSSEVWQYERFQPDS
jgi:hypothetical protein